MLEYLLQKLLYNRKLFVFYPNLFSATAMTTISFHKALLTAVIVQGSWCQLFTFTQRFSIALFVILEWICYIFYKDVLLPYLRYRLLSLFILFNSSIKSLMSEFDIIFSCMLYKVLIKNEKYFAIIKINSYNEIFK